MNKTRDSKPTEAQLERDLQEVFRKREWAAPQVDDRQLDDRFMSSGRSRPGEVEGALARFDRRHGAKARLAHGPYWTNRSVLALMDDDPITAITQRARQVVLEAMETGWTGPPYDPFALAESLGIRIRPTSDVIDARTYGTAGGEFTIEFNPDRPPARIRYSVAHEVAHTFFPDCADAIRNRATHEGMVADEWQLEMLCNIAAAEILVPMGALGEDREIQPTVQRVLDLRRKFQVSFEAMVLRLVRITDYECFAFAARFDGDSGRYKLDYKMSSCTWRSAPRLEPGFALPRRSAASECTAVGYTSIKEERWLSGGDTWSVEYLGIPPYLGQIRPRVIGLVCPLERGISRKYRIKYLIGDASEPRSAGKRMIVQIVNDKALIWGAGFSRQLRKKWPRAQAEFRGWALARKQEFKLGGVHMVRIDESTTLASVVAQHGYGPSDHPRIRYSALSESLRTVSERAVAIGAAIQMPRIGTGLAGGSWEIVEEIIEDSLCRLGLSVTVCDLPERMRVQQNQASLAFGRTKPD
jgi:Zn-dependent peptidase ImmA (M78 family)